MITADYENLTVYFDNRFVSDFNSEESLRSWLEVYEPICLTFTQAYQARPRSKDVSVVVSATNWLSNAEYGAEGLITFDEDTGRVIDIVSGVACDLEWYTKKYMLPRSINRMIESLNNNTHFKKWSYKFKGIYYGNRLIKIFETNRMALKYAFANLKRIKNFDENAEFVAKLDADKAAVYASIEADMAYYSMMTDLKLSRISKLKSTITREGGAAYEHRNSDPVFAESCVKLKDAAVIELKSMLGTNEDAPYLDENIEEAIKYAESQDRDRKELMINEGIIAGTFDQRTRKPIDPNRVIKRRRKKYEGLSINMQISRNRDKIDRKIRESNRRPLTDDEEYEMSHVMGELEWKRHDAAVIKRKERIEYLADLDKRRKYEDLDLRAIMLCEMISTLTPEAFDAELAIIASVDAKMAKRSPEQNAERVANYKNKNKRRGKTVKDTDKAAKRKAYLADLEKRRFYEDPEYRAEMLCEMITVLTPEEFDAELKVIASVDAKMAKRSPEENAARIAEHRMYTECKNLHINSLTIHSKRNISKATAIARNDRVNWRKACSDINNRGKVIIEMLKFTKPENVANEIAIMTWMDIKNGY